MAVLMTVNFDTQIYDQIERDAKNLPRAYRAEFMRRTRNPIRNLRRRLRKAPARKPAHPFVWSHNQAAQLRARRWWFAAIAGKIPGVRIQTDGNRYRRTGKLNKSINVKFNRALRSITIISDAKGIEYVMGKKQVPSHKKTGWKRIDKELEKAEVEMSDVAIKTWFDIADKVGA